MLAMLLAVGLPAVLAAGVLLWLAPYSLLLRGTLAGVIIASWIWLAALMRDRLIRPLQTIANLLAALREGDFSFGARDASSDGART